MSKKAKFYGLFFSLTNLLSFNFLTVSCGKKLDSTVSNTSTNDSKQAFSQEIKAAVKSKIAPQGDNAILAIDELLSSMNFTNSQKNKWTARQEIERFLNKSSTDLKNSREDAIKIEIKNNEILQKALKDKIYENCSTAAKFLKTEHKDDFAEVNVDKILEIDESSLMYKLKKFSIRRIFEGIGDENENEVRKIFDNAETVNIYNLSFDLDITISNGGNKKDSITIKDTSMFIIFDKEKKLLITEDINAYFKNRVESKDTSIYLDDVFLNGTVNIAGKSNREINEHFPEIIKVKNYDITNENNMQQITSFLERIYLPSLIYSSKVSDRNNKLYVTAKELVMEPENLNFQYENGLKMSDELKGEINFLKLFGDSQKNAQIKTSSTDKISVEGFLKDSTLHQNKYYLLGSGKFRINDWNINGFPIIGVDMKFKIYIMSDILKKEVRNLKTCLNRVIEVMKQSSIETIPSVTPPSDQNYTVKIKMPNDSSHGNSDSYFDKILNVSYMEPAKKEAERKNFNDGSGIFFNFDTKVGNELEMTYNNSSPKKYSSSSSATDKEKLEIYFVFGNSFKIRLDDNSLVKKNGTAVNEIILE